MNKLLISTITLLLIASFPALASTTTSIDTSYLTYQEFTPRKHDFMHLTSRMLGIHIQSNKALNHRWSLSPDIRAAYGDESYYGGTSNYNTGEITSLTEHHIPNLYANVKINLDYHAWSHFTPHIGMAYRFFQTDDSNFNSGAYLRRSNYFYMPIGFSYKIIAIPHWKLNFNLEQNIFIEGKQYSDNRYAPQQSYTEHAQYYGNGTSVSIDIKKDDWPIALQPYFNFWHIENSEPYFYSIENKHGYTLEPNNTSKEYGLRISWIPT